MPAPVYIDFTVRNLPDVQRAFRTVHDAAARAESAATSVTKSGASARERVYAKAVSEQARLEREKARAAARAEAEHTRAAAREAAKRTREVEREARDKIRAMQRTDAAVRRIQEQSAREAARIEQRKDAEAMRWVARRERQSERSAAGRRAAVANVLGGGASAGVRAGFNAARTGIQSVAGTMMSLGGSFSIADSVQRSTAMQRQANVLAASTELAGEGTRKIGSGEILSTAREIGLKQAIDPAEILKGFDEVKKLTGDLDKAMAIMPEVAKLATATGGDVAQMSGLAANILASSPDISNADLKNQMRIFAKQGVVGGVEIADFAKYGSRLTAGASLFGGDKMTNQATLGAYAQIARQYGGASSAAEAAMGAQRFATDIASHSGKLKAKGIDVSDKHGNLKDPREILSDMLAKTGGDVTKFKDVGLGERGVRVLTGAAAIYKNAGGGEAGKKAVDAELKKYTTGVSDKELDKANSLALGGADAKMERVRQQFDQAVSERLIPKILEMVPVIEKTIPAFIDLSASAIPAFVELGKTVSEFVDSNRGLIRSIGSHPIGAMMALEATKSIAAAGIGMAVQKALMTQLGGSAGITVAAATMAVAVGTIVIEKAADDLNKGRNKNIAESMGGHEEALYLQRRVREGKATPEEIQRLSGMRDAMQSSVEEQSKNVNKTSWTEKIGWFMGGDSGIGKMLGASGNESQEYQKAREQQLQSSQKTLDEMNRALAEAAKGVRALGSAANDAAQATKGSAAARDTNMTKR